MEAVWNEVKAAIKERIPGHSYRIWIEPIKFYQTQNGNLVLTCPNFFSRKRVQENYGSIINSEMSKALGRDCGVTIVVSTDNGGQKPRAKSSVQLALPNVQIRPHSGRLLRREFTFEHFVVGGNNDFAYSASLALASSEDELTVGPRFTGVVHAAANVAPTTRRTITTLELKTIVFPS